MWFNGAVKEVGEQPLALARSGGQCVGASWDHARRGSAPFMLSRRIYKTSERTTVRSLTMQSYMDRKVENGQTMKSPSARTWTHLVKILQRNMPCWKVELFQARRRARGCNAELRQQEQRRYWVRPRKKTISHDQFLCAIQSTGKNSLHESIIGFS